MDLKLVIKWHEKGAKNYTDIIPFEWFQKDGVLTEKVHAVRGPRSRAYDAKCNIKVSGDIAELDYGAYPVFNQHNGMELGILKLKFSSNTRTEIPIVLWKDKSGVNFNRQNAEATLEVGKQYWLEVYWHARDREFLGVWFHDKKRYGPDDIRAEDRVIFYEAKTNPEDGSAGAGRIFALGTLKDDIRKVPAKHRTFGGRRWKCIRYAEPIMQLAPSEGVPFDDICKRLPAFKGWVRRGVRLTPEHFRLLEEMLRERYSEASGIRSIDEVTKSEDEEEKKAGALSRERLKERAQQAQTEPAEVALTKSYPRDPYVAKFAKVRADGKCDLCGEKAPFVGSDGEPFLECHHIIMRADGGPDTIENTVALCPNCHRKMHNLKLAQDIESLKIRALRE